MENLAYGPDPETLFRLVTRIDITRITELSAELLLYHVTIIMLMIIFDDGTWERFCAEDS
jgi:hypothetical protein